MSASEPVNVTLDDILPVAARILLLGSTADVQGAIDHTILGVYYADGPDIDVEWREQILERVRSYLAGLPIDRARAELWAVAVELGCTLYDGIAEAFPVAEDSTP